MKLFSKKISLMLAATVLSNSIFAQTVNIQDLVDTDLYTKLSKNGKIVLIHEEYDNELSLLPKSDYSNQIKGNRVEKADKNFPFIFEGLYLLNKKDILKESNSSATKLDIEDVSRVLRSVSKMQGMEYYSTTKKKIQVLYDKAYMVADAKSNKPIADQNTGNADGQVSYCFQNDSSFGVNHYRLNYYQKQNSMLAVFTIADIMGLGPFKAIYPEKMKISILVEDCGDDLLLYICTDLDSVKFPGIKGQIVDSMTSRMDAVYNWFLKQF